MLRFTCRPGASAAGLTVAEATLLEAVRAGAPPVVLELPEPLEPVSWVFPVPPPPPPPQAARPKESASNKPIRERVTERLK
jgi:hypothetical protein